MTAKILVIDDEEGIRLSFEDFLSEAGYAVSTRDSFETGLAEIQKQEFDIVYLDIVLPDGRGTDMLKHIKRLYPMTAVVMITGVPNLDSATASLRADAFDYIVKPIRQHRLLSCTSIALKDKQLKEEREKCRINFEAIFRSVDEGVITVDENLNVVEVNEAAESICECKRGQTIGKPFEQIAQRCNGTCLSTLTQSIKNKKTVGLRFVECRRENRRSQIVSVTASPLIKFGSRLSGAVLLVRDETHLTNLERRIRNRNAPENLVGRSAGIQKIREQIRQLAEVRTTVLLVGESGTGKEVVVDALHDCGERRYGPLVKFNCAALSENLIEDELFGHVAGAFTGATRDKLGRFQLADGGTLFLDEIGDISPKTQLRLLRVIETMKFERLGDTLPQSVDVRIVAATNQNLKSLVARGAFRQDLYFRLKVFQIELPPLRERKGDIPLLVEYFRREFNDKFDKHIKGISTDALDMLYEFPWTGNVRELKNFIEYAFVVCRKDILTVADFPDGLIENGPTGGHLDFSDSSSELSKIQDALERSAGNKTQAARLLGVNRRTIYRKIKKYKGLL